MGSWIFTAMLSKFSFPLETFQSIRLLSKTSSTAEQPTTQPVVECASTSFQGWKKTPPSESGSLKDFHQDL